MNDNHVTRDMIFFVVLAFLLSAAILLMIGGQPLLGMVLYYSAFVGGMALVP